ncbi:MAG: hypothetical protein LBT41_03390 [Candidatus Methanoplasma sp.]|nr:hypothetical protein [Candidatus Methanoplasma sp.]
MNNEQSWYNMCMKNLQAKVGLTKTEARIFLSPNWERASRIEKDLGITYEEFREIKKTAEKKVEDSGVNLSDSGCMLPTLFI